MWFVWIRWIVLHYTTIDFLTLVNFLKTLPFSSFMKFKSLNNDFPSLNSLQPIILTINNVVETIIVIQNYIYFQLLSFLLTNTQTFLLVLSAFRCWLAVYIDSLVNPTIDIDFKIDCLGHVINSQSLPTN